MVMLRTFWLALVTTCRVTWRRVRRGPLLPGWSFRLELLTEIERAVITLVLPMHPSVLRKLADRVAPGMPFRDRVSTEVVEADGVRGEWIAPKQGSGERVILYLHGGGYALGSITMYRDLVTRLALDADAKVFALDYRLAPEHPFPAAVDDAARAYRWLLAQGVDPGRLAVAGDSAGGGLSLALLQRLREAGEPLPAAVAVICPWVDLTNSGKTFESHAATDTLSRPMLEVWSARYRAGEDARNPLVSPLHADLSGLPPLLVQAGGAEVLLDQIAAFAERAHAAGVDVTCDIQPQMIHVVHLLARFLPEGRQAISDVAAFLRRRTQLEH